jgi:hypothetical protein
MTGPQANFAPRRHSTRTTKTRNNVRRPQFVRNTTRQKKRIRSGKYYIGGYLRPGVTDHHVFRLCAIILNKSFTVPQHRNGLSAAPRIRFKCTSKILEIVSPRSARKEKLMFIDFPEKICFWTRIPAATNIIFNIVYFIDRIWWVYRSQRNN